MTSRAFATSLLLILSGLTPASSEGQPREILEDVHYRSVESPLEDPGGPDFIVVNELFWYGCPRCASLSPLTSDWRDGIRGDLRFSRTPVIWNPSMQRHARIFFSAARLDLGDPFHEAVYHALHNEGRSLMTDEAVIGLFSEHGVNATDFQAAWESPEVDAAIRAAVQMSDGLKLDRIPALLIDGRYVVNRNSAVSDHHEMIITTNLLIRKLRDETP